MQTSGPMRLGVVGLRRRFTYDLLPSLSLVRQQFSLHTIHDPSLPRTMRWSQLTRTRPARSLSELIESPDVQAICLADACWYGVWPALRCAELGKPVACLDDWILLHAAATDTRLPQQGVWPLLAGTTAGYAQLVQLLRGELGAVQSVTVVGQARAPVRLLLEGLWLSASLLEQLPESWQVQVSRDGRLASVMLGWPGGQAAQVNLRQSKVGRAKLGVAVIAERGTATLALPNRLAWRNATGHHRLRLVAAWERTQVLLGQLAAASAAAAAGAASAASAAAGAANERALAANEPAAAAAPAPLGSVDWSGLLKLAHAVLNAQEPLQRVIARALR